MAKPLVFTIKDTAGNYLPSKEIIMGAIEVIKSEDIVSQLTTGPQAQAILENGQVARYRYFKDYFIGDQEESVIYTALKAGNGVAATDWVKDEINIDLDDSRTTKPKIYRTQDAQALEINFANNFNLMMNTIVRRRQVRFFERLRLVAKNNAALADGITRVIDTTAVTSDEDFTRLVQSGIANLADFYGDIFSNEDIDALGIDPSVQIGVFNFKSLTRISNTQAFNGGSNSQQQLEKGTITVLSEVELKRYAFGTGIDGYILVRGAVQEPIGNVEKVEDPVGNFMKQWMRWDMAKEGSSEELFTYVIAFGDPAVINA